jgi:hypothetical protein
MGIGTETGMGMGIGTETGMGMGMEMDNLSALQATINSTKQAMGGAGNESEREIKSPLHSKTVYNNHSKPDIVRSMGAGMGAGMGTGMGMGIDKLSALQATIDATKQTMSVDTHSITGTGMGTGIGADAAGAWEIAQYESESPLHAKLVYRSKPESPLHAKLVYNRPLMGMGMGTDALSALQATINATKQTMSVDRHAGMGIGIDVNESANRDRDHDHDRDHGRDRACDHGRDEINTYTDTVADADADADADRVVGEDSLWLLVDAVER